MLKFSQFLKEDGVAGIAGPTNQTAGVAGLKADVPGPSPLLMTVRRIIKKKKDAKN